MLLRRHLSHRLRLGHCLLQRLLPLHRSLSCWPIIRMPHCTRVLPSTSILRCIGVSRDDGAQVRIIVRIAVMLCACIRCRRRRRFITGFISTRLVQLGTNK